jgi:hypothetical protein
MRRPFFTLLLCTIIFSYLISTASAQSTPTPAPSKTPEATAEATTEFGIIENTRLARSFTQADLTVLTGNVQRPNGIAWIDGKLYISCSGDWTLYEVDAESGSTITFVSGVRDAHQIYGEKTDDGFNLWIPDFDTNTLFLATHRRTAPRRIATDSLNGPWGIALLDEESFLVTNLKGNTIVRVTREGTVEEVAAELRSPAGIVVDRDYVYVANNGSARRAIEWFEKDQRGDSVNLRSLVSGLQSVSNLTLASDGFLYFTYSLGTRGVVGRVDPEECRENGCSNEEVEIVVYSELPAPLAGLTISSNMELFVHTIYRPEVYKVNLYE